MIFNMATDNGDNNSLPLLDATPNEEEQCEFNFLKRKHDTDTELTITNVEINNQDGHLTVHYQGSNDENAWKKRHIEPTLSTESTTTTTTTTTEQPTNPDENLNSPNCFHITNDFNGANHISPTHGLSGGDYNDTTQQMDTTITNINNNNTNDNNNNDHTISNDNNNNNNNNDVTFNLIHNSSFINDLFGYDAGLIVPVSVACGASNTVIMPATPTFTTVANSTEPFDESNNWQATDLLELDHRYNSGLQTEISQLTPTVNLRHQMNNSTTSLLMTRQTSQQSATTDADFLFPQKQIIGDHHQHHHHSHDNSTVGSSLTRYRSVANLSNLENLPKPDSSESDFEDKNLSWLLNFKFDELPHLSPDISGGNVALNATNQGAAVVNGKQSSQSHPNASIQSNDSRSRSPKTSASTKTGKKFEELVMEVTASEVDGNDMVVGEHVAVEDSPAKVVKKPPFTYTELIEYALEDKSELTVSGIYQWISDRFPYYKSNDDRWKNSVRHNLSINPHFRKGNKAPQGAGHLWTISSGDSAENVLAWEHKKQRLELFFKMESINRERLQQHKQQQQQRTGQCVSPLNHQGCQNGQCVFDETAKATAVLTQELQEMQDHSATTTTTTTSSSTRNDTSTTIGLATTANEHQQRLGNTQILNELPFNDLLSDEELRKTAGQILNGIHRDVEVQSVNSIISTYHDVLLDNDYLNPIHKDIAVNESGLRHSASSHQHSSHHTTTAHHNSSQYYVTEIDPLELGIHINPMSHQVHEEEVLFNDDFNLNYFGYNTGNDIVA